jgi:hypothetical protein
MGLFFLQLKERNSTSQFDFNTGLNKISLLLLHFERTVIICLETRLRAAYQFRNISSVKGYILSSEVW